MLSDKAKSDIADSLIEAKRKKKPAKRPSELYPDMTIEDAYAISSIVAERNTADGANLIGHKIGLTSMAMQRASNIHEPDFGYLFDTMLIEDGAKVSHDAYCTPRVELELTFRLGRALKGPNVGLLEAMDAIDCVIPSIEILDAHFEEPRKILDTVSDNGAAAGIVLGGKVFRPGEVDLRWVSGVLYRNTDIEETGVAMGVLGNPVLAVAWLANKLAPFDTALEPGHLVLSGSFVRPVWAGKGDTIRADFGPLGSLSVQFV